MTSALIIEEFMFIIVIFTDKSLLLISLLVVVKMILEKILAGICQCYTVNTDLSWCSSHCYSTHILLIYCLFKLYLVIFFIC